MAKVKEVKEEKATIVVAKPFGNAIVTPAVDSAQAVEAWKKYEELKSKIINKANDIQSIQGKDYLKKSYWRKIATFFNLSTEIVEERSEKIGNTFAWHFTIKAIAPNGRYAIGTGSCDVYEKAEWKNNTWMRWDYESNKWKQAKANSIHNIRSTAETRAFNRAVSNLVGGGEVSYEEVSN